MKEINSVILFGVYEWVLVKKRKEVLVCPVIIDVVNVDSGYVLHGKDV